MIDAVVEFDKGVLGPEFLTDLFAIVTQAMFVRAAVPLRSYPPTLITPTTCNVRSITLYDYAHSQVTGSARVLMYDNCLGSESNRGMLGSELIARNNRFRSTDGVLIDASFSGGTSALVGNDFTEINGLAVRLGPNSSKCLVVLTAPATVEDLGTGNVIIGPKQAGGGQRRTIRPLLRMPRRR